MSLIAPLVSVYQAGTLSGNPLAMSAGIAMLERLRAPGVYAELERKAAILAAGLADAAREAGAPVQVNRVGSMLTAFFAAEPVTDYISAKRSDALLYAGYFRALLERGVYFAPSQFEAGFVSTAHTEDDLAPTIDAVRAALRAGDQFDD